MVFSSLIMAAPFQVIYGAFATLPILLLWIYLCWAIVLVGAELARLVRGLSRSRGRRSFDIWEHFSSSMSALIKGSAVSIRSLAGRYELSSEQITTTSPI